jgi:hypothetical protein
VVSAWNISTAVIDDVVHDAHDPSRDGEAAFTDTEEGMSTQKEKSPQLRGPLSLKRILVAVIAVLLLIAVGVGIALSQPDDNGIRYPHNTPRCSVTPDAQCGVNYGNP